MKIYFIVLLVCQVIVCVVDAQPANGVHWAADGNSFYEISDSGIVQTQLPAFTTQTIVANAQLTPAGAQQPLAIENFFFQMMAKKCSFLPTAKKYGATIPAAIIGCTIKRATA